MIKRRLKINKDMSTPFGKKIKGQIIDVECDINSLPLNLFWRSRLKDSEIDNCVELVEEKQSKQKKESKKFTKSKQDDVIFEDINN